MALRVLGNADIPVDESDGGSDSDPDEHIATEQTVSETDSNESDEESVQDNSEPRATRTKRAGFKEWAQRQINLVKGPISESSNGPDLPAENLLERPIVARPRQSRPSDAVLRHPPGSENHGAPRTSLADLYLSEIMLLRPPSHPKGLSMSLARTRSNNHACYSLLSQRSKVLLKPYASILW